MKKLLYILSLLLCPALVSLESCQQQKTAKETIDSTVIRLGVLPTMECLPFYYADSTGIFDSLGIDVRLVTFDAAMDADTAFTGGSIDAIASDMVKVALWEETDSIHMVMNADLRLYLVTARNARLLSMESLKEKIIGSTRHSSVDLFIDKALESAKMKSIDLNKPQINNLRLRTLMTDQNQYDGAVLPEPFASEAVARGAKRLCSTTDLNLSGMFCVAASDSIFRTREAEVAKLKDAYDIAVRAMNADTTSQIRGFFPHKHTMYIPDTLYTYVPINESCSQSDSLKEVVKAWLIGRGLIKGKKK